MSSGRTPIEPMHPDAQDAGTYLEQLTKAVFRAGISWRVVEMKWPRVRELFDNFDPTVVAGYPPRRIEQLASEPEMIRNHRKIAATVANARVLLALTGQHGDFRAYLRSRGDPEAVSLDLQRQFQFIGESSARWFLRSVGEAATKPPGGDRRSPPAQSRHWA